jgi:sec-independent protein translocase protein TatA
MGELSPLHWLVVLAIVMLFFGGRRIPELMKGLGEGVRSFKEGMNETSSAKTQASTPAPSLNAAPQAIEKK